LRITEIFEYEKKTFSFEFFPPKNYQSILELGINIGQLLKLSPSFISVTYGAGGSTQELSFDLIDYIQNKIGLTTMAHYTCINAKVISSMQAILYP
jgi:methylenetetrahydrofolate reductase (NADPH)